MSERTQTHRRQIPGIERVRCGHCNGKGFVRRP